MTSCKYDSARLFWKSPGIFSYKMFSSKRFVAQWKPVALLLKTLMKSLNDFISQSQRTKTMQRLKWIQIHVAYMKCKEMCPGTRKSHWLWFHLWYLDEKLVTPIPAMETTICLDLAWFHSDWQLFMWFILVCLVVERVHYMIVFLLPHCVAFLHLQRIRKKSAPGEALGLQLITVVSPA